MKLYKKLTIGITAILILIICLIAGYFRFKDNGGNLVYTNKQLGIKIKG